MASVTNSIMTGLWIIVADCYTGSLLASTGDSGKLHLWKEDINGNYIEFAEMDPT